MSQSARNSREKWSRHSILAVFAVAITMVALTSPAAASDRAAVGTEGGAHETTVVAMRRRVMLRAAAEGDPVAVEEITRQVLAPPERTPAEVAVDTALAQVGKPYRTAGKGPDRFDCSGLTGFAWADAGVPLPPSSRTQYAGLPHVALDELEPGDLVFRGSPIHHVGMYIGDGLMVHSPQTGEFVRVEAVDFSRVRGAARPWSPPAE